ncbi:S9 family peptidase [Pseudonocardia sp. HH130630-07]|uniref:S9 family peptidase n=1 Tax=Pseudonocardia sp. HH130630-07 TaxID=1690815 RepID=UPI000814BA08|nr:DPP IV N-terminal domain-containing protein [Pseudonocardia sp. HH130630-07]ANY09392.1 peptidase S9 [Pseudonocardia sp. HH130630-07]
MPTATPTAGSDRFQEFLDGVDRLVSGGVVAPVWSPDGTELAFLDGDADHRTGTRVDLASGTVRDLCPDVAAVRALVREATGVTPAGRGLPFDHIVYAAPGRLLAGVGAARVTLDLDDGTVTAVPAEHPMDVALGWAESVRATPQPYLRSVPLMDPREAREIPSPRGDVLASTVEGNVVLRAVVDGRTVALTTDGTPEHEYRLEEPIAVAGPAAPAAGWSPEGDRLVVSRADLRGVHRAARIHYGKRGDEVVQLPFARAGGVLERTTLHVLDLQGRPPVELDLGDTTDTYPVVAGWLADGARLVVVVVSRDCRRAEVRLADAATGATRVLFTEEAETFLRIHHDVYYGRRTGLTVVPDGGGLVWQSTRSGWNHLYLHDLDGNPVRTLTDGEWAVDDVVHVDSEHVYVTARLDRARPYDVHLARVPLAGGPVQQLSEGPGTHSMTMAPDGGAFVDTWSTPADPPCSVLRRADGTLLCELSRADASRLEWTPPREFTATAADGVTELWGTMFLPADFTEDGRYPLVDYVYGGPQIAVAPHTFSSVFGSHAQALAQLGHVVVVVDGRGTPGRSKAFHDVVYRDWGRALVADHAAVVGQLRERHAFLAPGGAGVVGHSWGGHSAFRLAAERPDVYSAAVCSAPGFDPYSSVLYECYLGFPQTDPEAYRAADPFRLAAGLEAEVMLAVGTNDHATVTDTMSMADALVRAGKLHEFVVLPGAYHGYAAVYDRYYWRKVEAFLRTHLQGA